MADQSAWLCLHGNDEILFFPESGRLLPTSRAVLNSFSDDASFFGRWHPLKCDIMSADLEAENVIAKREKRHLIIERPDLWILIRARLDPVFVHHNLLNLERPSTASTQPLHSSQQLFLS